AGLARGGWKRPRPRNSDGEASHRGVRAMRRSISKLSRKNTNPIAPLWNWFASQGPLWWNTHVAFHGPRRILLIDGARWMMYLNIHGGRQTARTSKIRLTAGISIQPPKAG